MAYEYKVGVFPGKFSPPHRGHLTAIMWAATKCERLYVVVSHNESENSRIFKESQLRAPDLKTKAKWMSQELQDIEHVRVLMLDETGIPDFPNGWEPWSHLLHDLILAQGETGIDVIFGGEPSYTEGYQKWFPETKYEVYDCDRTRFPISATEIRNNPYKDNNWNYVLGAARPYFTKRVLIVGTESCGKTTLTKMLAKFYNTSWALEYGRDYHKEFLGGNEDVYDTEDFYNIVIGQRALEDQALRTANKVTFFDTEALVTQYYCEIYTGKKNPAIEPLIDPSRYDLVLYLTPDVEWVDDGQRFISDQREREAMDQKLFKMFVQYGFGEKMVVISGDYTQRLDKALAIVDDFMTK